ILFMYISRIASNEKFIFSIKLTLINILIIITILFVNINFNSQNINISINFNNEYCNYFINKLYTLPSGNITLLIIIYLLFTLIIVSNIIKLKIAPFRRN
ncbi:MAG: hypothetical protein ACEY3M_17735, partial [Wolbachia sp.]